MRSAQHSEIKAAFQYYTVARGTPLRQLMGDALVLARDLGHDVFNALDLFDNRSVLEATLSQERLIGALPHSRCACTIAHAWSWKSRATLHQW